MSLGPGRDNRIHQFSSHRKYISGLESGVATGKVHQGLAWWTLVTSSCCLADLLCVVTVQQSMLPSESAAQPLSAASACRGQTAAWLHPPTGWVLSGFLRGWQSSGGHGSVVTPAGWSLWTWCWQSTKTAWCARPNASPPALKETRFEWMLHYYWHTSQLNQVQITTEQIISNLLLDLFYFVFLGNIFKQTPLNKL